MGRNSQPPCPTTEWVTITPELAFRWLEKNTHNRPLVQARVDRYSLDMRADKWLLNGDAIRFDVNDTLLDGQHRLWAVTDSGVPLRTLVIRGLQPEAQDTIDQGKSRSVAEVFHLQGITRANLRAPILTLLFQIATNRPQVYTPALAKEMHEYWRKELDWIVEKVTRYTKRAQIATTLVIAHRQHPAEIDALTDMLNSGENLKAGTPAYLLREYIISMMGQKKKRDVAMVMVRKALRAEAAHILGLRLNKLVDAETGWQYFIPNRSVLAPRSIIQTLWRPETPEQEKS